MLQRQRWPQPHLSLRHPVFPRINPFPSTPPRLYIVPTWHSPYKRPETSAPHCGHSMANAHERYCIDFSHYRGTYPRRSDNGRVYSEPTVGRCVYYFDNCAIPYRPYTTRGRDGVNLTLDSVI